jgi:hypothetical protein
MTEQSMTPILEEVVYHLRRLPEDSQRRVLELARALAPADSTGTPGRNLLGFVRSITDEDLALMRQAIHDGCEQIDESDW